MRILATILSLFLLVTSAGAASIVVRWDLPTEEVYGDDVRGLSGVMIYWGRESSNYTRVVKLGLVNEYTLTGLEDGELYYLNGTAVYYGKEESAFTTEISKIASPKPKEPVFLYVITQKAEKNE